MRETNKGSVGRWRSERHEALVIAAFRRGEFDYLAGAHAVNAADCFRALAEGQVGAQRATRYRTPREKAAVPLWVELASDLRRGFPGEPHCPALP